MKYIIIGQVMLWANIVSIILGYYLVAQFQLPEFVAGLTGFVGVVGSVVNCIFSVFLQVHGYQTFNVLPKSL